tara:strand:+ start:5107 stop:5478 length:372 start_codon:yes stop_codon:yes gene_type:complete
MKNKHSKQSGMTLLEVMVALSIFSIAAMAIMNSLTQQIRNLPYVEESLLAGWAANNRMVEEQFKKKHSGGKTKGKFEKEMMGRQFYWQTDVKSSGEGYRVITVSISDTEEFERTLAELQFYEW